MTRVLIKQIISKKILQNHLWESNNESTPTEFFLE